MSTAGPASPTEIIEANFDGLVGPSHHFGGLGVGNVASQRNAAQPSNPREAALQGLDKMAALMDLGIAQGVLPPQARPDVGFLRSMGFSGDDATVLRRAGREAPGLLSASASAAAMWTANAATVSAGSDTPDGRVHLTPANLVSQLHRSLEVPTTTRALAATFPDPEHFSHHAPLPANGQLGDEGAANHTRFGRGPGRGVNLYVYGSDLHAGPRGPYPARQTRLASEAVARQHGLDPRTTVFARQHPDAIAAGVFHNDVIAVGHGDVLLYHEHAFADEAATLDAINAAAEAAGCGPLQPLRIAEDDVSVADAVATYLFNSQIVTQPDGTVRLIVAADCREHAGVWRTIEALVDGPGPIDAVSVFDVRQSMRNGGGPACLRLRVPLTTQQAGAVNAGSWCSPDQLDTLRTWVTTHYRDRLTVDDLADPAFLQEVHTALDALTALLGLGSLYAFQQS